MRWFGLSICEPVADEIHQPLEFVIAQDNRRGQERIHPRHDELAAILGTRLAIDRRYALVAQGRFEWNTEDGEWGPLRVRWHCNDDGQRADRQGV